MIPTDVTHAYATYGRYSYDEKNPTSIKDQRRKCKEFGEPQGWKEVAAFADESMSGAGADRPDYQRLLAAVKRRDRAFSIILVDDLSRIARNAAELMTLLQDLRFYHVRLIAISQGLDSEDRQAKLLFAMHGIKDELYIDEGGYRTFRTLEGRFEAGKSTGGRTYGFIGGDEEQIEPDEARVLIEIFEHRAGGGSYKKIAKFLNDRGIPPPQKRADRQNSSWCPTAIRAMLRNRKYKGEWIWNKRKFTKKPGSNKRRAELNPRSEWKIQKRPDLQIIPDELWARVEKRERQLTEKYAQNGRVSRAATSGHLLSGFLICAECGGRLIIASGTGKYATFACGNALNRGVCSNRARIKELTIEELFFHELQDAIVTPEAVEYLVQTLLKVQEQRLARSDITKRIARLETEIDNLVSSLAATRNSEHVAKAIVERESELRQVKLALEVAKKPLTAEEITERVVSGVRDLPALLRKDPAKAKAKLADHVDQIRMLPQPDGSYVAEGEWDLLGGAEFAPQMVAGAGFEPATFGL